MDKSLAAYIALKYSEAKRWPPEPYDSILCGDSPEILLLFSTPKEQWGIEDWRLYDEFIGVRGEELANEVTRLTGEIEVARVKASRRKYSVENEGTLLTPAPPKPRGRPGKKVPSKTIETGFMLLRLKKNNQYKTDTETVIAYLKSQGDRCPEIKKNRSLLNAMSKAKKTPLS